MKKTRRVGLVFVIGAIVVVLGGIGWLATIIFESEAPQIKLDASSDYLSGSQNFAVTVSDEVRGLRSLKVSVKQEGREATVLEESFPFQGLLNREGVHRFQKTFSVDPSAENLAQGGAMLVVQVRDYSRRMGGDGNLAVVQHKMVVDTVPPAVSAVSRMHNVRVGGAGLVVYRTSSDTAESGLFVGSRFFRGFPAGKAYPEGYRVCYFAVPNADDRKADVYLWAKDKAGNEARATFYYRIRGRHFRSERINISDGFLRRVLPYFSFYSFKPGESDVEKFLDINRNLRKENAKVFLDQCMKTSPQRLWDGEWLRLNNAANMAKFGDRRSYYYQGKKIDEQVHLGVDLASLAGSEVQAANNGRVIFAERLGIYGLTVILDHGQGLSSSYSHLSKISVAPGQEVRRGETIGLTGQTGLAGGDHLHFGVLVDGIPVDPVEWWDSHWIEDNVLGKLDSLDKG